ncbi:MAG: 2-hydroxyglutaryl-CoA dehydratase [Peptococcaceae bacterium BICA1-8]|nr:MAG: 2-hydroxyglutaryl-CoA dehydratase [Peptococcaceae bacterium BICA1-8]
MSIFFGIDVGSVSTNLVLINEENEVIYSSYLRTQGRPIEAIKNGLIKMLSSMPQGMDIIGVGATGSGRQLASMIVGADVVKNEITAHAVAAANQIPDVHSVLEIGGQDSKIIILDNGIVSDFAMNTVCAAGTGSFLDQQAARLGLTIQEFAALALEAKNPVRIAGRCSVFAESDMIHKQQLGHSTSDIVAGLCQALVRNYLNNVGKGKDIKAPVIFQGGVAANPGIKIAFAEALGLEIIVPKHYSVMGALGAAILAREAVAQNGKSNFSGFGLIHSDFLTSSFECKGCPNLCEVIELFVDNTLKARWGDKCNKWSDIIEDAI